MSDINKELRQEIEQEVNAISVNTDLDKMPEGMGLLIPSLDLQKSIDRIMELITQHDQALRTKLTEALPKKQYMHQFYEGNTAEPPSRKEANREVTSIRNATIDGITKAINHTYGGSV